MSAPDHLAPPLACAAAQGRTRPSNRSLTLGASLTLAGAGIPVGWVGVARPDDAWAWVAAGLLVLSAVAWTWRDAGGAPAQVRGADASGSIPPVSSALACIEDWSRAARADMANAGRSLLADLPPEVADVEVSETTAAALRRMAADALAVVLGHAGPATVLRVELEMIQGETGRHLRLAVLETGIQIRTTTENDAPGRCRNARLAALQRAATQVGAQLDIGLQGHPCCIEVVMPLTSISERI